MSTAPNAGMQVEPDRRQQFIDGLEREHATTLRVLRAYPADKIDLKPHPKCKTARELAWMFVVEQALCLKAVTTGFDWANPPKGRPEPPATMDEIVTELEKAHRDLADAVRVMRDDQVSGTVSFFTAPRTLGDVPTLQFLWMILSDQIHHRGQFSVYLRMADGRVPSIYGPTADEPWM
jgi:uncharacterized damage-inducible protein DinB